MPVKQKLTSCSSDAVADQWNDEVRSKPSAASKGRQQEVTSLAANYATFRSVGRWATAWITMLSLVVCGCATHALFQLSARRRRALQDDHRKDELSARRRPGTHGPRRHCGPADDRQSRGDRVSRHHIARCGAFSTDAFDGDSRPRWSVAAIARQRSHHLRARPCRNRSALWCRQRLERVRCHARREHDIEQESAGAEQCVPRRRHAVARHRQRDVPTTNRQDDGRRHAVHAVAQHRLHAQQCARQRVPERVEHVH